MSLAGLPSVLTIAEAALDLQTTEARVWKFHRDGRLAVMYMAGSPTADRRGAKDGRIDRGEWDRFKRELTVNFAPPPTPESEPARRGRPKAGADPGGFLDKLEKKIRKADLG